MLRPRNPFLVTMLSVVLSSLLVVMTAAFIVIPYVTGGHPGEARSAVTSGAKYHPT